MTSVDLPSLTVSGTWSDSGSGALHCMCEVMMPTGAIAAGCDDSEIRLFDLRSKNKVQVLSGHAAKVRSLCSSGPFLYSGAFDGTIRQWDLRKNASLASVSVGENGIYGMWAGSKVLLSVGDAGILNVFAANNLSKLHSAASSHTASIYALHVAEGCLYTGGADHLINFWS